MPMRRMACGAGTCEGGENILKQRADSPGRIQPVAGDAATAGQGHAARSAGTLGGRIAGFLAALDRGSDVHRTGKHIPPDTRILIRGPHNKFLSARDGVNEPLLPRAASAAHFVSWLALCPDNDISGGKLLWRGARRVKNRAGHLFRMAAYALHRSLTPF